MPDIPQAVSSELRFWVDSAGVLYQVGPDETDGEWIENHASVLPLPIKYRRLGFGNDAPLNRDPVITELTEGILFDVGYAKVSFHDKALFITAARHTPREKIMNIVWAIADYIKEVDFVQVAVQSVGPDNFTRLVVYKNREWF